MRSLTAHIKRVSLAVVALSSLSLYQSALAATGETTAGTDISNTATVNYTVGTVPQTAINSTPVTFKVDKKVDLTVANGAGVDTVPGATNVGLPFTVSNTGNDTDSFTLTPANATGDSFDTSAFAVYLDVGVVGTYEPGIDTLVGAPVSMARDTTINVLIVSTIPGTALNGNTANMTLTATTTSTATAGAETPTVVDVVFADAGRNGTEVDTNTYTIATATLTVTKTATVLADPINCPGGVGTCGANLPKAIPGATVEYTITVSNSSTTVAASLVQVTDAFTTVVSPTTAYVAGSIAKTGGTAAAPTDANVVGNTVTVPVGTLAVSSAATVTFRVTVN